MFAGLLEGANPNKDWGIEKVSTKLASGTSTSAPPRPVEESDSLICYSTTETLVNIGSDTSIDEWIKLLSSDQIAVRWNVAQVLIRIAEKHPNEIASYLSYFLTLIPTLSGKQALKVITAIQANCKFYNYEIYQAHLAAQQGDNSASQTSRSPLTYEVNAEIVQIVENNYGTIRK